MTISATIDIETLSTSPESVVLSIGCVKFNPYTTEEPYDGRHFRLTIEEQTERGREIDEGTLDWWSRQSPEIQADALGDEGRITPLAFMQELNQWLFGVDKIWCQGPQFDIVILENLYKQFDHHCNWKYWQIMDSRTLFYLLPNDPRKKIQQQLHNALADAYFQSVCVQQAFKELGLQPKKNNESI
jgi:hypothetical protein